MAVYSGGGSELEWKEVDSGDLPSPRGFLRATLVCNKLYVSGGYELGAYLTSILSWDPEAETWREAGKLALAREYHAAVAVPTKIIAPYCKK